MDTGATRLYLKPSVIKALGLRKTGEVNSRTTNGDRRRNVYAPVRLDLMKRDGVFEVVDLDEHAPTCSARFRSSISISSWTRRPRPCAPTPRTATSS